jgi:predicted DCC family thiol-disulfide oxidoreductase YuxK
MDKPPVLLYDGVCYLCNGLVRFTIRWDRKKKINFASLQSDTGKAYLKALSLPTDDLNTLVYIRAGEHFIRSTAVLEILKDLGGFWRSFYIFILIPKCLRDPVYRLVARLRYRIFGKRDSCKLPSPETRDRFLDV